MRKSYYKTLKEKHAKLVNYVVELQKLILVHSDETLKKQVTEIILKHYGNLLDMKKNIVLN